MHIKKEAVSKVRRSFLDNFNAKSDTISPNFKVCKEMWLRH